MKAPAHLAHLRTDRAGRPVPYINVIGEHDVEERFSIRHDRAVGHIGLFYADDFTGEPNFLRQSPQRQRECMVRGLCQVCARPVPWPGRQLVVSSVSVETIDGPRGPVAVVTEPWLCPPCAAFATQVCPTLIRRRHGDDLTVVPVTGLEHCELVLSKGWVEGRYEAATRKHPVAMWVKVHLAASVATIQMSGAKR